MRKSALEARNSGLVNDGDARKTAVSRHNGGAKTGIFSIFTVHRSQVAGLNAGIRSKRCKNKKIVAQYGAVKVVFGALPLFGQLQKLGATSCSK